MKLQWQQFVAYATNCCHYLAKNGYLLADSIAGVKQPLVASAAMCFHFAMKEPRVWSCCFVLALAGCTTVPETGRRQLNLMPPAEEMQLGLSSFEQVKKETPINGDPTINALVQKVGQRIATVAPLPNAQWEFVVFEDRKSTRLNSSHPSLSR